MQPNPLRLRSLHHIELWVGNAKQAAYFYRHAFGFSQVAYAGLETGQRAQASYVLAQGRIRLVLSTPLSPDHPASDHLRAHGDGVCDIAFHVDDAVTAFDEAVRRGAAPAVEPRVLSDSHGTVRHAAIRTYGDTVHSFVSYDTYDGPFLPGFAPAPERADDLGLLRIDHVVGNVELGKMNEWVGFYERAMGFRNLVSFDDKAISTEYSALMSKVMANGNQRIKFPINEPAQGRRRSQIDEYLEFYGGAGVQHVALATRDIVSTVTMLRDRGIEFLKVPDAYYDDVLQRVGRIDEELAPLHELGILVDRDDEGYLLQIFTRPVEDRPTLFFEIIQRKGARSFGAGNFKALFEAIEREQARRGTL